MLGDFNDDIDASIVSGYASPYENFISDPDYSIITKALTDNGWHSTISYDDMIDHQLISSSLTGYFTSNRIVNPFLLTPLYATTTSDHLPVMSEFDLTRTVTGFDEDDLIRIFPNPASNLI
jgi:hypothetical protein